MHPNNRDKLIVALSIGDLITELNQAMKVRKITLSIDYTQKDHLIRLVAAMPGASAETWMITNTRTKVCAQLAAQDPHLQLFFTDAKERLSKMGGALVLVGQKRHLGPAVAKLQLCVEGSENTAVTLHKTIKGKVSPALTHFLPPAIKS